MLRGVDFSGLEITNVIFYKADLSLANLTSTRFLWVVFVGANLTGAELREASLDKVELGDATFSWEQLEAAGFVDRYIGNAGSQPTL